MILVLLVSMERVALVHNNGGTGDDDGTGDDPVVGRGMTNPGY